ncbi:hypothetical protein HAX54_035170, partial [Datura stramonium]|nr:hypothetical protein [Datura stramonium]
MLRHPLLFSNMLNWLPLLYGMEPQAPYTLSRWFLTLLKVTMSSPFSWKVHRITSKHRGRPIGRRVHPPATRASTRKVMEDALKERQAKI